ncbi:MAG: hypothetical protein CM1200mP1_01840 [Candidatus Neomarinimicrobiota bacterium]|nr:MAG: hypothetical protein CM1200mP1_01840 [Candidatus Neomarinimicrobiota bacterium]
MILFLVVPIPSYTLRSSEKNITGKQAEHALDLGALL